MDASRAIIERLMELPSPSREDVERVKFEVCGALGVGRIPGNADLIRALREGEERRRLLQILRRKRVRSASGVIVIAAMTKPLPCPHGRCAYCPGGPEAGVPQSYTGHEPASMRGAQNLYDPYRQVESRIRQLRAIGHRVDKVELIIMGGTFPAAPESYQRYFVKGCLEGLLGRRTGSLEEAKLLAGGGEIRNVGITVETRPDYAREEQVDRLLEMGVTRVEIGVQNIYDDIYRLVERGHTVEDVIEATRILKDSGLKVCYHMMPGLPGSSPERDLLAFKRIFQDPDFRPDMLKIYPCLVIKGTKLYEWWRRGEYEPLSTEEAVELLVKVKEMVPPWVRIMRIQRDIPAGLIEAGVRKSNLRQLVAERLRELGKRCRCIRCREVGHRLLKEGVEPDPDDLELTRRTYEASEGVEEFLSIEDRRRDILVALLRLRIPSERAHRPEIDPSKDSIVRELHVYGPMVPVGRRFPGAWQHRGWGSILLSEAERLSREEYDRRKILVMSALGTKRYYMERDYRRDGVYVSKDL
ncbi:tRNA uridine(34) 5-carboxymethylaminomethyl modification radical SAM/GNAT enzyme Elp3 [Candidatus Bathyarchaeota archaeon]|nr:tRNA uridine(34) 5-carboxymethylaminomethyl modification radical SAM/GNAT enzyme Elp3 [Candidatus Bathyarchaeota archaeon]